ncbi:hypothetical protein [Priestia megaterium]
MEQENKYQAVDSLRVAIIEYLDKQRELEEVGIDITSFDEVLTHMSNALTALLPNSSYCFEEAIEDFSTDDLFFIEEKAISNEIDSVRMSNRGTEVTLTNGETIVFKQQ